MPFGPKWMQPLPPPEEEPQVSEVEIEDIYLPDISEVAAWRLLNLIDAFLVKLGTPTLDDMDSLIALAVSHADLHHACDALRHGFGVERCVELFI